MARPLRIEFSGAVYHVTSRGNDRRPIFRSDRDRRAFLELLGQAAKRFGWTITAWVLMSNHFHLVVQTPEPNLSRGMHWLNGTYAAWFNRRYTRSGHLFGGRFKAFLIDKETYFVEVLRYVVLNPVRAAIVKRAADYRWSSYRATAHLENAPEWLDTTTALSQFDSDLETAVVRYRAFVEAKLESDERLWDKLLNGIYLGTEAWAKKLRRVVESKPRSTDHPKIHRAIGRPMMPAIVAAVAQVAGVTESSVRETHGGPLRQLVAWIGWNEGLVTLRTIAASLRLRSEGQISRLIRRCEREFRSNQFLLVQMDRALAIVRC